MNAENEPATRPQGRRTILWAALITVVVIGFVALLWSFSGRDARPLLPALPTHTPNPLIFEDDAETVDFSELNNNPFVYLNRRIQVTGDYTPQAPPECSRFTGPRIRWALVADDLQLDAMGFERVVALLEPGTTLTVEGIWRLYEGPIGCGKGPARGRAWYLDVRKILQPNPLVDASGNVIPLDVDGGVLGFPDLLPTQTTPETTGATPTATTTPITAPAITPTGELTITTTPPPTRPISGTPSPESGTPGAPGAPPTTTPSGGTPEATTTPGAGETSTPEPPVVSSPTPGGPGYPGGSTSTPDPYP